MTAAPTYERQFDMPALLDHAFLSSSARPREFYCWLHGWNNTHKGNVCSVMTRDNQYKVEMRIAASPDIHCHWWKPKNRRPDNTHSSSSCFPSVSFAQVECLSLFFSPFVSPMCPYHPS
jgi:hypothetical protein